MKWHKATALDLPSTPNSVMSKICSHYTGRAEKGWTAAIAEMEHMCVSNGLLLHYSKRWPNPGSKVDSLQPSAERPQRPGQSPEGKHTKTFFLKHH